MKVRIRLFESYSIAEVLCDYDFFFRQFEWSVISGVDSSDEVSSFIFNEGVNGVPLGNSAIVDLPELLRIAKDDYFHGFDEVWFSNRFPQQEIPLTDNEFPYVEEHGSLIRYTPLLEGPHEYRIEKYDCDQDLPPLEILSQKHLDWFQDSEYLMGMGDGNGLLCVYKDPIVLPWE